MLKFWTGVGSRETPEEILKVMEDLAFKLSQEDWILRSGGAAGADSAFEYGAHNSFSSVIPEIYLPWETFNGRSVDGEMYIYSAKLPSWDEAKRMASEIHPVWETLKGSVRALHARNCMQVLGKDLKTPSKFLVCYARVTKHGVVGGTRTAVELAKQNNIPCFNLYDSVDLERIKRYIGE